MSATQVRISRILGAALFAAPILGQEILWQAVGRPNDSALQEYVAVVGDINGDGYEDLANIGLTAQSNQHAQTPTIIRILSGHTGAILRTRLPSPTNFHFIRIARAGDWNGDGVSDYVVTRYAFTWPYDPNVVEVLSGLDDRVLMHASFPPFVGAGEDIASNLDTDGDGRPDLLVSVYRELPQGGVYVISNRGVLRYRLPTNGCGRLGAIGDVDRDGCDDFAYSDSDAQLPGGAVRVVSGRAGQRLYTVSGDVIGDGLGTGMIVGCGDVDGDGIPDFAVSNSGAWNANGMLRVFSGRQGATIRTIRKGFGPNNQPAGWGEVLASGFDLDQDGIQDLVVGGCQYFCDTARSVGNRLYVYLLRNGHEVEICPPDVSSLTRFTFFGYRVTAGKPQPGNPFSVFACGEYHFGVPSATYDQGRITMMRLPPSTIRPYGDPCFGTLAAAPRAGVVDLGRAGVRVQVSNTAESSPAVLLIGDSDRAWGNMPLPVNLTTLGLPSCLLRTSVLLTLATYTGASGAASGYGFVDVPVPAATGAPRGTLYAQWLVLGRGDQVPGGLSAALSWRY